MHADVIQKLTEKVMNETEVNFFALVNQFETEQGEKSEKSKKRKSRLKVKMKKWVCFLVKSKNIAAEEAVEKYLAKYPEKTTMIIETDGPESEETYHQKTIESIGKYSNSQSSVYPIQARTRNLSIGENVKTWTRYFLFFFPTRPSD